MLSHPGQRGQQHRRLQGLERLLRRLPGQRDPIGEENGVEGPALCYTRDVLEELDLDEGRWVVEHAPATRVTTGARDVDIQMELAVVMRHRGDPPAAALEIRGVADNHAVIVAADPACGPAATILAGTTGTGVGQLLGTVSGSKTGLKTTDTL